MSKKPQRFGKVDRPKAPARPDQSVERREEAGGTVWIAGRKPLIELVKLRPKSIRRVYVLETAEGGKEFHDALKELERRSVNVTRTTREKLDELGEGISHQGVLAAVEPRTPMSLEEIIRVAEKGNGMLLALDEINDPQNFGAILRSAEALGADGIITSARRSAVLNATARRVSAGASEFIPLAEVGNLAQAVRTLKSKNFWIVGTSLSPNSEDLARAKIQKPVVVIIGSEGQGLRPLTEKLCDFLVRIPMKGKIQSLNASHATTVVLYEVAKKL